MNDNKSEWCPTTALIKYINFWFCYFVQTKIGKIDVVDVQYISCLKLASRINSVFIEEKFCLFIKSVQYTENK